MYGRKLVVLAAFWLLTYSLTFPQWVKVKELSVAPQTTDIEYNQLNHSRTFIEKLKPESDTQLANKFNLKSSRSVTGKFALSSPISLGDGQLVKVTPEEKSKIYPVFTKIPGSNIVENANYAISHLDNESGLKSANISTIAFDQNFDVWVGYASGGLSCLRGNNIFHLGEPEGVENDLISSICFFKGKMWIGTFGGGLYLLDQNVLYRYSKEIGFPSDHILKMDTWGENLWIGTYSAGLIRFDGTNFFHYSPEVGVPSVVGGLATDTLHQKLYLSDYHNGLFEINAQHQLSKLTANLPQMQTGTLVDISVSNGKLAGVLTKESYFTYEEGNITLYSPPGSEEWSTIFLPKSDNVWLGDNRGNAWIGYSERCMKITQQEGLSKSGINFIHQDAMGNIWLSTAQNGIFIVSVSNFRTLLNESNSNYATQSRVSSSDKYALFQEAEGIALMDNAYNISRYKHPMLAAGNGIVTTPGKIWVSAFGGLLEITNDSLFIHKVAIDGDAGWNSFTGISTSRDNTRLLLSNYNYSYLEFDIRNAVWKSPIKSEKFSYLSSVFEDSKGRIWMASLKSGVAYIQGNKRIVLAENWGEVTDFVEDQEGNIWIGTSQGLLSYTASGQLMHHPFPSPEFNPEIRSLIWNAKQQAIWAGTASGVISYAPESNVLRLFGKNYGINGSYFTRNSSGMAGEYMYWTTNKGLIQYLPFTTKIATIKPVLNLTRIQVDYQNPDWAALQQSGNVSFSRFEGTTPIDLVLPFSTEVLSLEFAVNYWGKDQEMSLFYRLNPNAGWIGPVSGSELVLSGLSAKDYQLEVKTLTNEGNESEIFSFPFTIRTPFYLTGWFLSLMVFVILAGSWLVFRKFFRIRLENIKTYSNRDEFITRTRLLGFVQAILLPAAAFMEKSAGLNGYGSFPYLILTLVAISGAAIVLYSYRPKVTQTSLRIWGLFNSLISTFFILHLAIISSYAPTFTIGFVLVVMFSAILFDHIRFFLAYLIISLGVVVFNLFWIDLGDQNHILFLTNFPLAFIFAGTYHMLQINKISTILFSDKVVNTYDKYVVVCDSDGRVVYCNQYVLEGFKLTEEEVMGAGWWILLGYTGERLTKVMNKVKRRFGDLTKNDVFETQNQIPGLEGIRTIEWQDQFIEGKFLMAIGTDVTELRQKEAQIRLLSLIASNTENQVIITDDQRRIEWVNNSFSRITGYSLEEVKGKSPGSFLQGSKTDPKTVEAIRAALANESSYSGEILNYAKSGKEYWISLDIQPIREKGKLTKFVAIEMDITAKKSAELALLNAVEESEKRYTLIAENTSDGIVILDREGNFIYASPTYRKMLGFSDDHPVNQKFQNYVPLVHPDDIDVVNKQVYNDIRNKKEQAVYTFRILHKSGNYIWREDSATYLYDAHGKYLKSYVIARDVTIRVQKEAEKEKLLGELSRSVQELKQFSYLTQHNLRAPVSNFKGLIRMLGQEAKEPTAQLLVQNLQKTTEEFDQTIQDISLILSVKDNENIQQTYVPLLTSLDRAMASVAQLVQGDSPEIISDFSQVPTVWFNDKYLENILTHLLSNALKFQSPDRPLTVRIATHTDGHHTVLTFSDNGIGMDTDFHKNRIFGLYQRFHANKEGKGLGLYLIKAQVEALGGKIVAKGMINQGLTFTITFAPGPDSKSGTGAARQG